jgi:predicted nucleic acid-binding protein
MRLLLDANVLLDCLVLEADGSRRMGYASSSKILDLCDAGFHQGMIAWHTLPIIHYYHSRQNTAEQSAALMDELMQLVEIPTVGHADACAWKSFGVVDFEDALQVAAAVAGCADCIITRNTADFVNARMPSLTPEAFLARQSGAANP